MSSSDCIFCKIINGDIPSYKVYEDEDTYAFLDINPIAKGHTLVIPKKCAAQLDELDGETVGKVMSNVPTIAKAVLKTTGVKHWNLLQNNGEVAGQAVFHVHFHIIPRVEGDGAGYRWNPGKLSEEDSKELLEGITGELGKSE